MPVPLTPEDAELVAVRIEARSASLFTLRIKTVKTRIVLVSAMIATAVVIPLTALIYALHLLSPENVPLYNYSLMMTLCLVVCTAVIIVVGIVDEVLGRQTRRLREMDMD